MPDFGDRDWFVCPKCGHKWNDTPSNYDYSNSPNIYCPECEEEIKDTQVESDMWYTQNSEMFAAAFLKHRGFPGLKGKDTSWYQISCYLDRFLDGAQDECKLWASSGWHDAYLIVLGYFNKPVIEKEGDPK